MKPQPIHTTTHKLISTTAMSTRIVMMLIGVWILVATSCSKVDSDVVTHNRQIGFTAGEAIWNQGLRGATYTGSHGDNPIPDMKVWGYYTKEKEWSEACTTSFPSFMNGVVVTNNGGIWSYAPVQYFYPTGYHSFFAVAPCSLLTADEDNEFGITDGLGTPELTYQLPEDEREHIDILYGWSINAMAEDGDAPVNINFRHATTKIAYSAKLADGYTLPPNHTFRIKSIQLSDIYTKATMHSSYCDLGDVNGMLWLDHSNLNDITVSVSEGTLLDVELSHTSQQISSDEYALFMIPQKLAERDGGVLAPQLTIVVEVGVDNQFSTISKSVDMGAITATWLPEQAYNFSIAYDGEFGEVSIRLIDPGKQDPDGLDPPLGE